MVLDDIIKSTLMSEIYKFLIYEGFMQHQTSRRIRIQVAMHTRVANVVAHHEKLLKQ